MRLGCESISAVKGKVIMEKLCSNGKILSLMGHIMKGFVYHAEELGLLAYRRGTF